MPPRTPPVQRIAESNHIDFACPMDVGNVKYRLEVLHNFPKQTAVAPYSVVQTVHDRIILNLPHLLCSVGEAPLVRRRLL